MIVNGKRKTWSIHDDGYKMYDRAQQLMYKDFLSPRERTELASLHLAMRKQKRAYAEHPKFRDQEFKTEQDRAAYRQKWEDKWYNPGREDYEKKRRRGKE